MEQRLWSLTKYRMYSMIILLKWEKKITKTDVDPLKFVTRVRNNISIQPITELQICKIVSNMEPKRSIGCDGISNYILKSIISCIKTPFCELINKSLYTGIFPDIMKIVKIVPLHNK